jgi:SET domain-containing protein
MKIRQAVTPENRREAMILAQVNGHEPYLSAADSIGAEPEKFWPNMYFLNADQMHVVRSKLRNRKPCPFRVYNSPIHGKGVIAAMLIPKGTYLGEYKGRRMTWDQAMENHPHNPDEPNHTFIFELDDPETNTVIDAFYEGNWTRWMNHSCDPSLEPIVEGEKLEDKRVRFYALRDIQPGEELLWDYRLEFNNTRYTEKLKREYECRCGSPKCRGTMLYKPRMKPLKRQPEPPRVAIP